MEPDIHAPRIGELPTLRQLNRATLIAAIVAAIILVLVVLPAEYGVDLTGFGRLVGLTQMGEAKRAAAASSTVVADTGDILLADNAAPTAPAGPAQNGEVTLTLQPSQGTEVKATMRAGEEFTYQWSTNGPAIHFELHGEEAGAPANSYLSYEIGDAASKSGRFRAPFDGRHGWYWRNSTAAPVTVTVTANGTFSRFEQLQRAVRPGSSGAPSGG